MSVGAAQVSGSQFEDLKRQLNETRGDLEETRRKLARAQDEINAKDAEVNGGTYMNIMILTIIKVQGQILQVLCGCWRSTHCHELSSLITRSFRGQIFFTGAEDLCFSRQHAVTSCRSNVAEFCLVL
jgi:hypothetical protein